jgi:hypothetical protein
MALQADISVVQTWAQDNWRRIEVVSLVLFLAIPSLPGCAPIYVNMLSDPEFHRCHSMDYHNREPIGLIGHVSPGMSEAGFIDTFQAHQFPGSKLIGPVSAKEGIFGGLPKNLSFSHAYLIEDTSGCPMWRYFFDENPRLLMTDTLYQEFGSYFFEPHSPHLTPPGVIGK